MAHTPGPWEIKPSGNGMGNIQAGVFTLTHHWPGVAKQDEMDANARLIASAPELLEACKMMIDQKTPFGEAISAVHAAIAKAEGR